MVQYPHRFVCHASQSNRFSPVVIHVTKFNIGVLQGLLFVWVQHPFHQPNLCSQLPLQALLVTRRTWLQKEQMRDPFQAFLGIDRLCPAAVLSPILPPPPPPLPPPPRDLSGPSPVFTGIPVPRVAMFARPPARATGGLTDRLAAAAARASSGVPIAFQRSIIDRVLSDYEIRHGLLGGIAPVANGAAVDGARRLGGVVFHEPEFHQPEVEELPEYYMPAAAGDMMQDMNDAGTDADEGDEDDRMELVEESLLRLIEILEVPRSAAISLLQQHDGDVEMAVMSFLHG